MSKRFGRNQRRRLRQRIANLEEEVQKDEDSVKRLRQELRDKKAELDHVARMIEAVAPNSVCLSAKTVRMDECPPETYKMGVYPKTPLDYTLNDLEPFTFREINLSRLKVVLEEYRSAFEVAVHVLIENNAEVGYYITREALECVGLPRDYIAREVVMALALYWRRQRERKLSF